MLDAPDPERLLEVTDVSVDEMPDLVRCERVFDHPEIDDVAGATVDALGDVPALDDLPPGAEVGLTAGSRGIHDMPEMLRAIVAELRERELEPFVFPAMGSHGGATPEGQRETVESLGVTEESVGCEIRSSLDVTEVGADPDGRPIFAADDALEADAVLLVNRVKAHTDFSGEVESGLSKMAVIGLGKRRGAGATHTAGLARGLDTAVPERAAVLFDETPIVGGVAVIENARDRAAEIVGLPVEAIPDEEPRLLERSKELLPMLPVTDLDLLVVDEIGKDVSGTGMDTNVIGRMRYHGQPEPEGIQYDRIYARGLTEASHGNGIGAGLADYAHVDLVSEIDLTEMYTNSITSGEPRRGNIPTVVPTDEVALCAAFANTGRRDPAEMRIARIPNTLDLGRFLVSEPIAAELEGREDVRVLDDRPLDLQDGALPAPRYEG